MKAVGKVAENITKWIAVLMMAVLFVILLGLFLNGFVFYEDASFLYEIAGTWGIIGFCALSVLFFILLYFISQSVLAKCTDRILKIFCIVMALCALALQCYFLFYVRSYYKWDSGFVIGAAASLAEKGQVAEEAFYYLSVYPNQNTFVLITAALVKFGNLLGIDTASRPLLFNVFNTVCLDVAVFLVFPILKKRKGALTPYDISKVLVFLLWNPFLYLGVSYYYTITLSLPLMQGFLYLALSLLKDIGDGTYTKKTLYAKAVFAGMLLGIGYELRATAVIFAIAFVIACIFALIHKQGKSIKSGGSVAVCILGIVAVLSSSCLGVGQKAYVGIDTTDTAFPASHWVMMSLTMPGSHNEEDEAYTASFAAKEEKQEAVKQRIAEKLDAMSFAEYVTLVKTKIKNTFGTGMNGYTVFLADAMRTDGIFEAVFGDHKDLVILWHQGYYLFVMLGILLALGRWLYHSIAVSETDDMLFLPALVLLGAILFYVLWEASEQYSVPFMFVMSILGFAGYERRDSRSGKQNTHKKGKKRSALLSYLSFGAALLVLAMGIRYDTDVTKIPREQSHTVANQILANTSYPVDDGEILLQQMQLKQPFNRLVIQWRNPAQELGNAGYSVVLRDAESRNIVFETVIQSAGTGYNGAGIYDFDTVEPAGGTYELEIKKLFGKPEDDLEFVVYDMYGYQAYPAGKLYLEDENGKRIQSGASLLFSVSMEYEKSYADRTQYMIFISVLFLIFLFMGFWCKLKVVSSAGEENT